MMDRRKTLVLEANGGTWKDLVADTVLGDWGARIQSSMPVGLRRRRWVRRILGQRYETLSYVFDWHEALAQTAELDIDFCNINNLGAYWRRLKSISDYELIIVLHSAAGDYLTPLLKTADKFGGRRGKLVVFLGNEYDLIAEKMEFVRRTTADYLCTQLPIDAARWLYSPCPAEILEMPHALNPNVYRPDANVPRVYDVGFIGDMYPYFLGDVERTRLIQYFHDHGSERGLLCEIRTQRILRADWAQFLKSCRGVVGAESGTYYLDQGGTLLASAKKYLSAHPHASFEQVFDLFFAQASNCVSGKAISSRHFEPIGTKTCQILLQGHYNGILVADEHYISIHKDLSNIDDAIRRFKDEEYRTCMAERTFEFVMDQHTYARRIQKLLRTVAG